MEPKIVGVTDNHIIVANKGNTYVVNIIAVFNSATYSEAVIAIAVSSDSSTVRQIKRHTDEGHEILWLIKKFTQKNLEKQYVQQN